MATNENNLPPHEEQTPFVSPGTYTYSPVTVTVKETVGVVFLGILSVILLIEWRRAEARYRALITQRELADGNHSLDAR